MFLSRLRFLYIALNFVISIGLSLLSLNASATNSNETEKTIESQAKVDTSQLKLHERPLPPRYNECEFCHTKKSRLFLKKGSLLKREHIGINPTHGKRIMSCNSCHDINNRNYLRNTKTFPASFSNSSPVCARCHMEKYRNWTAGLHGKRTGGWRQPLVQYQCIDCHQPHSVTFPKMESVAQPIPSIYVIQKNEEHSKGEH